jgi:flavodoxin
MAKTLILYYSPTNTTKRIAETIADRLGADIHEIQAQQPYTAADLNWNNPQSRTTIEQHEHGKRVPIKDDLPDLTGYQNVIIGHPIWWGIPPRLISATIDTLDLNGKHLATFATSGGSNYDRSQSYVERTVKENGYDVQLNQGQVLNSPAQVDAWLNSLNLA